MSFVRTKIIKGKAYLYEVENRRVGGKVRQKVLQYLGPATSGAVKAYKKKKRSN